jgi:hypothetical protein
MHRPCRAVAAPLLQRARHLIAHQRAHSTLRLATPPWPGTATEHVGGCARPTSRGMNAAHLGMLVRTLARSVHRQPPRSEILLISKARETNDWAANELRGSSAFVLRSNTSRYSETISKGQCAPLPHLQKHNRVPHKTRSFLLVPAEADAIMRKLRPGCLCRCLQLVSQQ